MIYKQFQDLKLSRLGMGNMRLPISGGKIDWEKAQQIILASKIAADGGMGQKLPACR